MAAPTQKKETTAAAPAATVPGAKKKIAAKEEPVVPLPPSIPAALEHPQATKGLPVLTHMMVALSAKSPVQPLKFTLAQHEAKSMKLVVADTKFESEDDLAMALEVAKACGIATEGCDKWMTFKLNVDNIEESLATLSEALKANSGFLVSTTGRAAMPTVADCSVAMQLIASGKWDMKTHAKKFPLVAKWSQSLRHHPAIKTIFTDFEDSLSAASSSSSSSSATAAEESNIAGSKGKFNLVDVKEGTVVVTRFAPEPSGFLHIGHIKAAIISDYFAHIKYPGGRLIIRFDDTNPAKEKKEFYESIMSDLTTVGVKADAVTYTSDNFDLLERYAVQMIKEGKAYIDDSTKEEMADGRFNGKESRNRNNTVERNMEMWEEMRKGSELGAKCVMRAKIDMQSLNRVMRDPSLYRCIANAHHLRTADKYHAYPLYDFAVPIIDSIEGVTHALRSSEYHDRNVLYDWVVDAVGLRRPKIEDFSRLNFGYVLLSKRKLQWFVDHGVVANWEDPRFPTVRGLMRRGLTVQAMRAFVESQGSSKALNLMEMDKLWALNKVILDPTVPRYAAVEDATRCVIKLTGADVPAEPVVRSDILRHKKNPALGMKNVTFADEIMIDGEDAREIAAGEEFTLMDWGNAVADKIEKDAASGAVTVIHAHLHLAGNPKDTKKKLTWLAAKGTPNTPLTLVEYDHLITAEKIPEGAEWEKFIRPESKVSYVAQGSPDIRMLKEGDKMQLERRGYFVVDKAATATEPAVLIMIPDGSSKKMLGQKLVLKW